MALRSLFLVLLSVAGIGAAWAWARVFWQQVEPAARRLLGKHWGVVIEWERSEQRIGWEIRGPERGRTNQVALASVMVWMLGFFTPCLLGIASVKLGLIPARPGFLLVFLSLLVSLLSWRLSINSPPKPMAWALASRQDAESRRIAAPAPVGEPKGSEPKGGKPGEGLSCYATAAGAIAGSTALSSWLEPHTQLEDLAMIYLLGIVLLSMLCSLRLAVISACVMVLDFNYLFVPPAFAFAAAELKHALTSVVMILVAVVVASLQQGLRRQERVARQAALRTRTLYEFEKELSVSGGADERVATAVRTLERLFRAEVQILFGRPTEHPAALDREQLSLADQAWIDRKTVAERSANSVRIYAPLLGSSGCLGVVLLSYEAGASGGHVSRDLVETCVSRLATSIESAQLGEAARRSELEAETERARSSLLSAVSHDLKTPLAAILAAGTTLLERHRDLDEATRAELLEAVVQETERLSRLVHDLLSVTRLESPGIVLHRSAESLEEIVTVALQRFESRPLRCPVRVDLPKDLPLVCVDPTLIEQLLINLMENCARYAGPQSPIDISASAEDDHLVVRVADHGPGVASAERERVFDKFYRGGNASTSDGGIGLGLTICRSIVFAHGGQIALRARDGGGALVQFTLPTLPAEPASPNGTKASSP